MKQLLDKDYQQRITILHYLETKPLQKASIKQIGSDLSLSSYVIKKEIGKIIEDFDFFHLSNLKLVIEDKDVYFYSTGKDSLLTLQWHYQKESKLFLLLDAIFRTEDFSFEDFSSTYYLSLSSSYLLKSELDTLLDSYGIYIDSNLNLSGNETTIRIFLYDVYFYSFSTLEFPFSKEIVALTNPLVHRIDKLYSMNYAPSQAAKLKFFLAILFQRLYAGNTIVLKEKPLENKSAHSPEKVMSVKQWFFDHTTLTSEEVTREVMFIYSFLIAEQLIMTYEPNATAKHIKTFCPEAFSLTNLLLNELEITLGINKNTPHFLTIKRGLLRIHYKFFHFTHTDAAYAFDFDFSFFKENYPDFYLFIKSFISNQQLDVTKANALKYDYLFLLIQYVPATIFSKPIYVCIDFSYGRSYNAFILENIQSFKFLNIIVEESLSEKTGLYLSDLKPFNVSCDYIIWKKPPLASDWEHFGNKIVELKEHERSYI